MRIGKIQIVNVEKMKLMVPRNEKEKDKEKGEGEKERKKEI